MLGSIAEAATLREWQRNAAQLYASHGEKDFTVTATPGAGKTTFALHIARGLKDRRIIDRIIVVAPTDHLRTQWAKAAATFGLQLDARLTNGQKLKPRMDGYVTTYAQVAAKPILHQRRTDLPNRTLVIMDEIHHAGEALSWGDAISEAFVGARRRLLLTGTPFRTSVEEKIPFVRYEADGDGLLASQSDYAYEYQHALGDHVVRPVVFAAYSGVASWRNSAGDMLSADLSEPTTKKEESAAWKAALNPDGQWVPSVIRAANDRLDELRAGTIPDAGCLILASDQESARAYARVVKNVTGHSPVVVLSDDPNASKKITAFDKGTERYIVAVRMVSEGVDVPRLACLVWLTSYQTPLFFAQAVGRVVRARNARETATVFLPSVRPLLALAADMETSRNHVLSTAPKSEGELDAFPMPTPEKTGAGKIEAVASEARFGHVLYGGKAILPTITEKISDEDGDFLGLPGLLSPEQSALLLAQREVDKAKAATPSSSVRSHPRILNESEESLSLRREVASLASQWANRTHIAVSQAHILLRNAHPGPKNSDAPNNLLRARRDWLLAKTI